MREALAPHEVPQEEKLRMLNEVLETDIRRLRTKLNKVQDDLTSVKELLESQKLIIEKLT